MTDHNTRCDMPENWDDLDAQPTFRAVDSIDLELALGCTDDLRKRLEALPVKARNDLRLSLQRKATALRAIDNRGQRVIVQLVAVPFVLAYTQENVVPLEASLIRQGSAPALVNHWRSAWEAMVPGARIIPASSCVLFDELLGAAPTDVFTCLQDGADYVQGGAANARPQLRVGEHAPRECWRSASGPVAATYLALAYVVRPDLTGDEDLAELHPNELPHGQMSRAAELLQAIFASRSEAPRIKVLSPAPFYAALRAAAVAHVHHFCDWGNDHDPTWSLDMIAPEASTLVEVIGTLEGAGMGEDSQPELPAVVRWGWDRVWWADAQIERFKAEVGSARPVASTLSGGAAHSGGEFVADAYAGALH